LDRSESIDSRMIGIFGPWGSGKSSFLERLKRRCEKQVEPKRLWVSFDAWTHQTEQMLTLAIVSRLADKGTEATREGLRHIALALAFGLGDFVLNAVSDGNLSMAAVGSALKKAEKAGLEQSKGEAIRDAFKVIVKDVLQEQQVKQIIIAIDNLDRCRPEVALSVLESLHLIQEVNHCIFLVAADQEVLTSFLNRAYLGTEFSGAKYLEKIFPEYFRIPDPHVWREDSDPQAKNDQILSLISSLLPSEGAWSNQNALVALTLWVHFSKSRILRNPRRIKRIIRRLTLGDATHAGNKEALNSILFLLILSDLWPEVYEFCLATDSSSWGMWVKFMAGATERKPLKGRCFDDQDLRSYVESVSKIRFGQEMNPIYTQATLFSYLRSVSTLGL
jgi:Ni2+-binding GTPase involved in maturation of urease and hydrogenase